MISILDFPIRTARAVREAEPEGLAMKGIDPIALSSPRSNLGPGRISPSGRFGTAGLPTLQEVSSAGSELESGFAKSSLGSGGDGANSPKYVCGPLLISYTSVMCVVQNFKLSLLNLSRHQEVDWKKSTELRTEILRCDISRVRCDISRCDISRCDISRVYWVQFIECTSDHMLQEDDWYSLIFLNHS